MGVKGHMEYGVPFFFIGSLMVLLSTAAKCHALPLNYFAVISLSWFSSWVPILILSDWVRISAHLLTLYFAPARLQVQWLMNAN